MYCSNCGTLLAQGLSYCNRCGSDLRERKESSNTAAISAMLTAITLIGIGGLGVLLFGALVLRRLDPALIGVFMLFTFLIVSLTEFMLFRNLSKLTSANESKKHFPAPPPLMNNEMRLPAAGSLGEPVPSVTESTTRTLEYSRYDRS